MTNWMLVAVLLGVMAIAYQLGLARSRTMAKAGDTRRAAMHSRPGYYGALVALWCGLPAFLVFAVWNIVEPSLIRNAVVTMVSPDSGALSPQQIGIVMRRVESIASGFGVAGDVTLEEAAAAAEMARLQTVGFYTKISLVIAILLGGLVFTYRRISPAFRARNHVEQIVRVTMFLASGVAILTTVGIVLSMVSETMRFFSFVSPFDFFFGTTWDPRFSSTSGSGSHGGFGILPLLSGTLLVSAVAMTVAVPIGLMTAIFLAEYATPRFRSIAKPIIEILAGIPTIVYGVFALIIVGPFFSAMGAAVGLEIRSTSALTAGFVMGIMLIPFISSLSDDIITQVPRSLRDASMGLGATRSETIRRVVLPAALPGVVGAVLLAASRAIGETMIVVLAAGNSPVLQGNPFEAVSTVTVTIVNQLTGDQDFASPQSLVAFALGLTLFIITLGLNVVALYIVRKYREQYD
jgi:phosphate transport system permease protein